MSDKQFYGFEAPPVVYARILEATVSDPIEGDYGTYQRIIVDYVPIDEENPSRNGEPGSLFLPLPKGFPKKVSPRSTLAQWLRRIAENASPRSVAKAVGEARGAKAALQVLEGRWCRMEEVDYSAGRGKTRGYFTPTDFYNSREEAIEAMLAEFSDDADEPHAEQAEDEMTRARKMWESLAALGDAREEAFRSLGWSDPDALIAKLKES